MEIRNWMSLLLFLATVLMGFVSYLSYRKRHLRVSRTMIFVMLAAAFYSFGYAFEILSTTLGGMKLALRIEYLGIPFVTTCWLLLVLQFTGTASRLPRRYQLLLFVIPVVTFISHITNDWHHLFYKEYVLGESDGSPIYYTVKGPLYLVHGFYNYLILVLGIALFIPMYLRSLPVVRKQIVILILGAAAPLLFNFAYLLDKTIDYTPFGFAVSGVVYVWGIFRFNLLRLTPLALAKVFETIRDGVVLLDYEGRIVSYNRAAEEVFPELSSAPSPAYGKDVMSDCPELLARIEAANSQDERFPFNRSQASRDRHYICSLSFVYDSGQIPVGKILMFNDVTELKENEARLRENAQQLSQLNAFKDKLFTVMAHDIRDPIALLVSLTELLGEEPTDTDLAHAEVFQEIKRQVSGTFHLVDNLLDWYRSQNGQVAFRPLAWNLQQVVRQALSQAGARAGMKHIRMTEHVDEAITVNADKEMLDLILRNLLSNAIKFTGIGGRIEIAASIEGDRVVVCVSDNGSGIDEETARLLRQEELFFKEPGHANEGDGGEMRFGLVLTREFLRIHGGKLQFESVLGQGTTFLFTLPGSVSGAGANESEGAAVRIYESHTG